MTANSPEFLRFYIRMVNSKLFSDLVAYAEDVEDVHFMAAREPDGSCILRTNDEALWQDLYLYGQMLAHAEGELIEAGHA
jgi:hypothetical protein